MSASPSTLRARTPLVPAATVVGVLTAWALPAGVSLVAAALVSLSGIAAVLSAASG